MENNQNVKMFILSKCPCCEKNIYLSVTFGTPNLQKIYKEEDLSEAKKTLKEKILKEGFKDTILAMEWINNEDNIIAPEDVDNIIQQLRDNENKIEIKK